MNSRWEQVHPLHVRLSLICNDAYVKTVPVVVCLLCVFAMRPQCWHLTLRSIYAKWAGACGSLRAETDCVTGRLLGWGNRSLLPTLLEKKNQRCRWHHPWNIWPVSWILWFKIGLAFCQGSLSGDFFFSLPLSSHPQQNPVGVNSAVCLKWGVNWCKNIHGALRWTVSKHDFI